MTDQPISQVEDYNVERGPMPRWRSMGGVGVALVCIASVGWLGIEAVFAFCKTVVFPLIAIGAIGYAWRQAQAAAQVERDLQARLTARDAQWQTFLDDYLQGLPTLNGQLSETAKQVEQAVVQVCEAFSGMATRVQDSVEQSTRNLQGEDEHSEARVNFQGLMETTRKTLEGTLNRVIENSTYSMRMVYRMEEVEEGMKEIVSALQEIEHIASRTKLLALNTTIEAARFGGQSKGFTVVASEITKLAARSTSASETIRQLVRRVNGDLHLAYEELRTMASADMSDAVMSREEVEKTLSIMTASNEAMRASVESAVHNSQALAQDIAQAVIGLQFQDTVNQRLLHVVEALQEMHDALTVATQGQLETMPEDLTGEKWMERMMQRYTMESERDVTINNAAGGGADAADNNVELF